MHISNFFPFISFPCVLNTYTFLTTVVHGFDEYTNLVVGEAEELNVNEKNKKRKPLGGILLKGDNITLMTNTQL
ncbi:hypothetical protein MUK42_32580 [Musa troglodytarum]|uniref:Sm protein E n=1 Tax=Musa troglodytarum TaxID=320322 RepID=A0A9E7IA26_9LILI|nr:hypothetical protein MUK42_32580 [Musa troglodytarum]